MPTYSATCATCHTQHDYIRKVDDRNDVPECCGTKTVRDLIAPMVSSMAFTGHKGFHMPDGKNNGKGTWIESGSDYNNYLKKNNVIPSSEAKSEAAMQKARKEKAADDRRKQTVIDVVQRAFNK